MCGREKKRDLSYFSNILHATGDLRIILKLKSEPRSRCCWPPRACGPFSTDWTAGQIDQGSPSVLWAVDSWGQKQASFLFSCADGALH